MSKHADHSAPDDAERGSATIFFLIASTAVLLAIGLLVDVGETLAAKAAAVEQAQQAARTGAQQLNTDSLRAGTLVIDPARAAAAAVAYLHDQGDTGSTTVRGHDVVVQARHVYHNRILSFFGLHQFTATATGTAALVSGIANPGDINVPHLRGTGGAHP
ncbi:pilus assembly protein TadG-related protein [Actinospica robiniae]|uniref:pilus assembly protein TadG-related protein n=1 Tax=Actinospica robiniae TaxID=304901 RepID=UPI0003FAE504|nr:pilus assembly protein TadG-related protein [Actinospica robiniae]